MSGPEGLPTHLRVETLIGSSETSTVWRARDTRRGADVALKVLSMSGAGDRVEHEVRALARLADIDGVVGIRECGVSTHGAAWLVTEFMEGGSLADRLVTGAVDGYDARRVGAELAATLARIHDRGVAHGDLTPANVLFDRGGSPRIADLGLAALGEELGARGCTPAYSPPERLRGAPPSPAADMWSLATIVIAAAGGVLPSGSITSEVVDVLDACRHVRPSRRPDAATLARTLSAPGRPRSRWSRRR